MVIGLPCRGWWFSSAGFFMHTNAYKCHHAVARSMTGLAAGGLARGPAARSITGLAADKKLYLFCRKGLTSRNFLSYYY